MSNEKIFMLLLKRGLIFILILSLFLGCTRDDICPEETPSTPLLVINFKDRANPGLTKSVDSLRIETTGDDPTLVYYSSAATDSIAIPLNTGSDLSSFRFIELAGNEDDENSDVLTFEYNRVDDYVNRACSFRTLYANLRVNRENDGDAFWITSFIILKTNIEDETEAHLTILH